LIGGALRRVSTQWRSISRHDKRREAPLIAKLSSRQGYH
jgi:hypothetical protein